MLFVSAMRHGPSVSVCEKPTLIFPPPVPPPVAPPSFLRQPPVTSARSATASRSANAPHLPLLSDFMFPLHCFINCGFRIAECGFEEECELSSSIRNPKSEIRNHFVGSIRSDSKRAAAPRAPPATSATRTPLSHGGRKLPSTSSPTSFHPRPSRPTAKR